MRGSPSEQMKRREGPGIRGWGPVGGSQFGANYLGVLNNQAQRNKTKMRRAERHGESALCLLNFPGSASLLFQLQG